VPDASRPAAEVTRVGTEITWADRWGTTKVRLGLGRMDQTVEPGLYAVGGPTEESPVLVTANYKLTFDTLRSQLGGRDLWMLVLDTKGVNVWCAAGKGTFGTDEIVTRVAAVGLDRVVSHRRLILPQLGAPGVSAHDVRERSGFRVVYGPVRADDLPAFLDAGMKATPEMRRVRFPFRDRAVLIPLELMGGAKKAVLIAACMLVLSGLNRGGYSPDRLLSFGVVNGLLFLGVFLVGVALPPLLLPWLPHRAFSAKGAWVGFIAAAALAGHAWAHPGFLPNHLAAVSWLLIAPALTSFLAMNFTGSSTYTSLSGVIREMKVAVPLQLTAAILGLVTWLVALFV